jgi:hypothetical protein
MNSHRRPIRNIILPAMVLFPLLLLMIGCLYIPTFEQVDQYGAKKDFRPLLGQGSAQHQITPRKITKGQIVALLGKPFAESANGQAAAYMITTSRGYWVEPLCFQSYHAFRTLHVLSLLYDENGLLVKTNSFDLDCDRHPIGLELNYVREEDFVWSAMADAMDKVNRDNGVPRDPRGRIASTSPFFIRQNVGVGSYLGSPPELPAPSTRPRR